MSAHRDFPYLPMKYYFAAERSGGRIVFVTLNMVGPACTPIALCAREGEGERVALN